MTDARTSKFFLDGINELMARASRGEHLEDYEEKPPEPEADFLDSIIADMSPEQRQKLAERLQGERFNADQKQLYAEYESKLKQLAERMRTNPFFKNECEKLRNQYRKRGLQI